MKLNAELVVVTVPCAKGPPGCFRHATFCFDAMSNHCMSSQTWPVQWFLEM